MNGTIRPINASVNFYNDVDVASPGLFILNSSPVLTSNSSAVSGNEGTTIPNSGTWSDPDAGNVVTLTTSVGTIVKNANGTWDWSIVTTDNLPTTTVTVTAVDGVRGRSSTTFTYIANNVAPVLTRALATVSGAILSTITNTGTYADVSADTVTLSVDVGTIINNNNGTWSWSIIPTAAVSNQTVTVTASDEDGGTSTVTFLLNAVAAITDSKVYYKGSGFTGIPSSLDSGKVLLKSSTATQTTSFGNVTNYSRGINGVVLDIAGLGSTNLTVADFIFRVAPSGAIGTVDPSTWALAPAPSAITATAGTSTAPGRVVLEWTDNVIQNTWLQIVVRANTNTGLVNREVFYLGHATGDIDGAAQYRVTTIDVGLVRAGVSNNLVLANEIRDVDKDRRITTIDVGFVRARVNNAIILNNITIPIAGTGAEGEDGFRPMNVLPTLPTSTKLETSTGNATELPKIGPRWTGMDYAVPFGPTATTSELKSLVYGPVALDDSATADTNSEVGLVDDFFSELGKKRAKKVS